MGTRSRIGILNKDGSIESIYCHWDGYLDHVGEILLVHYRDEDKVRRLMELGDISSLGPELGEKHSFDMHTPDQCTAYGRDREEPGATKTTYSDGIEKFLTERGEEFNYFFSEKDQAWYVASGYFPDEGLNLLTDGFIRFINNMDDEEE